MGIRTIPGTIYIAAVEGRLDYLYAFSSESEAERFAAAVIENGGDCEVYDLPLNLSPEHTDAVIAAEVDDDEEGS